MSFHGQLPPASLYVMEEQHDASHNEIRSYQCNSVVLHELDCIYCSVHDRLVDPWSVHNYGIYECSLCF